MENLEKKARDRGLAFPQKGNQDVLLGPFFPAEARNLPPLTEAQKNKLRHLSVVTLAAKVKVSDSPPVVSHRASFCTSLHKGHLKGICTGTAFDTLLLLPAFPSTFFLDLYLNICSLFRLSIFLLAVCFVFIFQSTLSSN